MISIYSSVLDEFNFHYEDTYYVFLWFNINALVIVSNCRKSKKLCPKTFSVSVPFFIMF